MEKEGPDRSHVEHSWVRLRPWRGWKGAIKEIQRGEKASIYVEARGKGIAKVLPDEE
jgi:hypothetical protein